MYGIRHLPEKKSEKMPRSGKRFIKENAFRKSPLSNCEDNRTNDVEHMAEMLYAGLKSTSNQINVLRYLGKIYT